VSPLPRCRQTFSRWPGYSGTASFSGKGSAIEATARRDGDAWLLNGVKWHVTSFNTADYAFFHAKKIDDAEREGAASVRQHLLFLVDLPSPGVRARARSSA
jgi:acyl-CoA dehydrogenase